jgi:hypothetical protein
LSIESKNEKIENAIFNYDIVVKFESAIAEIDPDEVMTFVPPPLLRISTVLMGKPFLIHFLAISSFSVIEG